MKLKLEESVQYFEPHKSTLQFTVVFNYILENIITTFFFYPGVGSPLAFMPLYVRGMHVLIPVHTQGVNAWWKLRPMWFKPKTSRLLLEAPSHPSYPLGTSKVKAIPWGQAS